MNQSEKENKVWGKNLNYTEKQIEFMSDWGILPAENDENLVKIEAGDLIRVNVGCDTGKVSIGGCFEQHGEKYLDKRYSSIWICKLCQALQELKIVNVFSPSEERINSFVVAAEAQEALERRQKELEAEENLQQRLQQKQEQEEQAEKGNRIVVLVERNLEYGTWRILGGEHGRLEKSVWLQARRELDEILADAARRVSADTFLASAPQPEKKKGKYYDLLSENFAYQIVSEIMEE